MHYRNLKDQFRSLRRTLLHDTGLRVGELVRLRWSDIRTELAGGAPLGYLQVRSGTRLCEGGVEAFTIIKVAGHSSVTVRQQYVHPTPETVERAFQRLEAFKAHVGQLPTLEHEFRRLLATVSAAVDSRVAVSC